MRSPFVTKLDVAECQLCCAIELFYANADVVVIHTLIAAAHNILVDIAKAEGKYGLLKIQLG